MRNLLSLMAMLLVGTCVTSCGVPPAQTPSRPSVSYEPRGSIDHASLAPLPGAGSASISEPSSAGASGGAQPTTSEDGKMIWRSSPRWATVKSDAKIEGSPN